MVRQMLQSWVGSGSGAGLGVGLLGPGLASGSAGVSVRGVCLEPVPVKPAGAG